MIETDHPTLSIRRQCQLLDLNRATFYRPPASESSLNLALMRLIDREYTQAPFYGYRKMTARLNNAHGYQVNSKRVARLMAKMGLQAVYPRPRTSLANPQHKKYPYLLRDLAIDRPNQVWAADITYVPLPQGFMYLVAILDWFSRFVLAWQLSNTLDGAFCLTALRRALRDGRPTSSTLTRACSSLLRRSLTNWKRLGFGSAGTVGAASWTTSSSNGCGGR